MENRWGKIYAREGRCKDRRNATRRRAREGDVEKQKGAEFFSSIRKVKSSSNKRTRKSGLQRERMGSGVGGCWAGGGRSAAPEGVLGTLKRQSLGIYTTKNWGRVQGIERGPSRANASTIGTPTKER